MTNLIVSKMAHTINLVFMNENENEDMNAINTITNMHALITTPVVSVYNLENTNNEQPMTIRQLGQVFNLARGPVRLTRQRGFHDLHTYLQSNVVVGY